MISIEFEMAHSIQSILLYLFFDNCYAFLSFFVNLETFNIILLDEAIQIDTIFKMSRLVFGNFSAMLLDLRQRIIKRRHGMV